MTKQETFDLAVAGVLAQGGPAVTDLGRCQYRGAGNTKCAAGHLIPDALYTRDMDDGGQIVTNEIARKVILDLGHDQDLVEALQTAHDEPANAGWRGERYLEAFRAACVRVAAQFGLDAKLVQSLS